MASTEGLMTITKLYRSEKGDMLTKYTIGKREYTFDEVKRRFTDGARGIPNSARLDGQIGKGEYLTDEWPHFKTQDELVMGWIKAGYPCDWFFFLDAHGESHGYERYMGQWTRLCEIRDGGMVWLEHAPSGMNLSDMRHLEA